MLDSGIERHGVSRFVVPVPEQDRQNEETSTAHRGHRFGRGPGDVIYGPHDDKIFSYRRLWLAPFPSLTRHAPAGQATVALKARAC